MSAVGAQLRRAVWVLLAATLTLLPFENQLPDVGVGPLTGTLVELLWGATLATWLVTVALERRLPRVPLLIAGALTVLLIGGVASAVLADGFNDEALRFVGRSAAGWLLFCLVVDLVRDESSIVGIGYCLVTGAALSAVAGLVLIGLPPEVTRWAVGQDFVAAGARRLQATYGYPTTAAMAFEATALIAAGLLALARGRALKLAIGAATAVLLVAMLLTLSRGAALGLAGGLAAIGALAFASRRRGIARRALAGMIVIVVATVIVEAAVVPIERLWADGPRSLYGARYHAPATATADPGGTARIEVAVTNSGGIPWNSSGSSYRLGFHWLDPASGALLGDSSERFDLGPVATGQTVTVTASVRPPRSGRFLLGWDVIEDEVAWFSTYGIPIATTRLATADVAPLPEPTGGPASDLILFPNAPPDPQRADLWRAALSMTAERPLLGVGPGTYRLRYGAYLDWPIWDDRIHSNNMYLELAATTGLVGLAAFALVVVHVAARSARSLARRNGNSARENAEWLLGAALFGAVVAFLVHGLVDYFLGFNPTNGLFWAVLGLAFAHARLGATPLSATEAGEP